MTSYARQRLWPRNRNFPPMKMTTPATPTSKKTHICIHEDDDDDDDDDDDICVCYNYVILKLLPYTLTSSQYNNEKQKLKLV
jgi:hypothetical protein